MKMEWKLSDFSEEKRKWNENMEMEMEFCKMETKMDFFLVEAETKTEQRFSAEQTRKWNFGFQLMRNFRFQLVLHGQYSRPNT
jgi:hypothetical protein